MTILDCTWLFLMNHKSETQHLLESFITFAQNQFQASIKTIRVDNGQEFISMYDFFLKKGIECHSSTKWSSRTQT